MSYEETTFNQFTWVYVLITSSVVLSFVILTYRYWLRPILTMILRIIPWTVEQRPSDVLETAQSSNRLKIVRPETAECPRCTNAAEKLTGEMTSQPELPIQMTPGAMTRSGPTVQPNPVERACFAKPGKFQLQ
jgi:hypothetical protein